MQPSRQPISRPSKQPTSQPSKYPSSQPFSRPSAQPSGTPTDQPFSIPTSVPSSIPTSVPTSVPFTAFPTKEYHSGYPSVFPTSAPSRDYTLDPSGQLAQLFRSSVVKYPSVLTYARLDNKGKSLYGTCLASDPGNFLASKYSPELPTAWNSFLDLNLDLVVDGTYFSSIAMEFGVQYYDTVAYKKSKILQVDYKSFVCNDTIISASIVYDLQSSKQYDYLCNGHIWRTFSCKRHNALCVDCHNGCTDCPGDESILTPCKTKCSTMSASFAVVHFGVKENILPPAILSMEVIPNNTSLTVTTEVSSAGIVTCIALTSGSILNLQIINTNGVAYIFSDNLTASNGLIAKITLQNLMPVTTYDVFCSTRDLVGHSMSLQYVLATKTVSTTLCCNKISFSSPMIWVQKTSSRVDDFAITNIILSAAPRQPENVYVNVSLCAQSADNSDYIFPTFEPNYFSFDQFSLSLSRPMKIFGFSEGCFIISATISLSGAYYSISSEVIVSSSLPLAEIVSAVFSVDGQKIFMTFNMDTNKGLFYFEPFSCSVRNLCYIITIS